MVENADSNNSQSPSSDQGGSVQDYLRLAADACEAGDTVLGMHLYLTAFERAAKGPLLPGSDAIDGLKRAWALSCKLGERALAEYIFDRLEPYLAPEEVARCADQLQRLALDKLEEFGLSREELEDMAEMISQDFLGIGEGASVKSIRMFTSPVARTPHALRASGADQPARPAKKEQTEKLAESEGEGGSEIAFATNERVTYKDLVGYTEAIRTMMSLGIGVGEDPEFQALVKKLNARHGLDRMPATDTLLLRAPAREDANRFAMATMGELDLPAVRLRVEEGFGGMPVLCVMAQNENQLHLGSAGAVFEGRGVLLLEDVDLWNGPGEEDPDMADAFGGLMSAHLSRGAREAMNLIRTAVDNPDVYVIATASSDLDIHPFFCEMLEPFTMIDIGYPTPAERVDIWMDIARRHPSLRSVDRAALVRLSAQLPRYDIYLAVREAIEEAYKDGLALRRYVPVTSENLFEKLAAFQPLDSDEYRELEGAVMRDFRRDLDAIESMLGEMEE